MRLSWCFSLAFYVSNYISVKTATVVEKCNSAVCANVTDTMLNPVRTCMHVPPIAVQK